MAYFPSSLAQRISLHGVKRIALALFACTIFAFLVLWRPTYLHLRSLQSEQIYWQNVMQTRRVNTHRDTKVSTFLTMDQLPDMIEQCRSEFSKESVEVVTLNVERFGERRETGKGASLDYGLVRLRLHGSWEGIIKAIKALEETQEVSIHIQEVVLNREGGEALLHIDFCTGL